MGWVYFIIGIILTIFVHEIGHLIAALVCGVKVEAFSIGFGKIICHKKIKGIDFRLSLILLGGYTKLAGEFDKRSDGFLAQPYFKKFIILISGVFMNILLAFLCYLINYSSISLGIMIDWEFLKVLSTKNYEPILHLISIYNPNLFLLQLSIMNFFCGLFNLIPFPALDGSLLWLVWLENIVPNFEKFLKIICGLGFIVLMILQVMLIYFIW